jgi:hypothetical protein
MLEVRIKPRAKRPGLLGWHGEALKIAVRAAPERGRANAEVVSLVAQALGLPAAAVEITSGATSQDKRLRIRGLDRATIRARLDAALGGAPEP